MDRADSGTAELAVSDYAELGSLAGYLRLAVPDVGVARGAGRAGGGEQGALDVLMVAADSSVLVAVIEVLPKFLQSRRKPGLTVTVTVEKKRRQLTVTADDPGDVRQVVEKFLGE